MLKLPTERWAEAVPPEMRALPRWVGWRLERRGAKPTKVPVDLGTGAPARTDDPTTFAPFEAAVRWYRDHEAEPGTGAGFVFTKGDGLVFVDLDNCLVPDSAPLPEGRRPREWAADVVRRLCGATYSEVSPSGEGVHVFALGELPRAEGVSGARAEVEDGAVEAYAERRFSTVTGVRYGAAKLSPTPPLELELALPGELWTRLRRDGPRTTSTGPEPLDRRYEVWGAMGHLDPDLAEPEWVKVGMALKDAFGDEGLPLWERWSSRGAKYRPGEPAQRWASFRRSGVGLGTLVRMAREAGWPGPTLEVGAEAFDEARGAWWTVPAEDVEDEQVEWLVRDLGLARGYASLVAGDAGRGKSMLMTEVAARLSAGRALPWEPSARPPCRVAYLNAEDGPGDMIKPRLRAAGADLSRVELLDVVGGSRVPQLPDDVEELEDYLRRLPDADLLIIDPLNAFLARSVDAHKAHDVRQALQPLGDALKRTRRATCIVAHLNKNEAASALYRVSGSADQVAFVRTAMLVGGDPDGEDDDLRVVAPLKWNVGRPPPARGFRFVSVPEAGPDVGRVEWGEEVEADAQDVVARSPGGRGGRVADAESWLRSSLSLSPRPSRELDAEARRAGLSRATLNRAAKRLGIRRERDLVVGGWRWPRVAPPAEVEDPDGGAKPPTRPA